MRCIALDDCICIAIWRQYRQEIPHHVGATQDIDRSITEVRYLLAHHACELMKTCIP